MKRKILPVLLPQFTFTGGGSAKYTYICRLRLWQLIAISNLAGWTPLHVAAEGGHEAVVEVLLRHKADCSLVTDTGLNDYDEVWFSRDLYKLQPWEGKTSEEKKRFLSGIAQIRGGGSTHAQIFWPLFFTK